MTYFRQGGPKGSIRRYPENEQSGERWDRMRKAWTRDCAPRRSCELTQDVKISEELSILERHIIQI